MMSEAMNFARNGVNSHALKTVSRACRKNGNEYHPALPLTLAHLAYVALQHEGVKQEKYGASLYFFVALDNVVGESHVCDAREDFADIAEMPIGAIVYEPHANILIHNKYYCDHRGYK